MEPWRRRQGIAGGGETETDQEGSQSQDGQFRDPEGQLLAGVR